MKRLKVVRMTTVPQSLVLLLKGQLEFMQSNDIEIIAVSAPGPEVKIIRENGIAHYEIPMTRTISPWMDLFCLIKLILLFIKHKPDVVHTHTPKAGLLGMLAAWIVRIPARFHTLAGLPLMELHGIKKWLVDKTERITYFCATAIYPNSFGLREYIIDKGMAPKNIKIKVIGNGSSNGIDIVYFSNFPHLVKESQDIRRSLNIPENAIVFSFLGRIVPDKGITELVHSFLAVNKNNPNTFLLIIGEFEKELYPLPEETQALMHERNNIFLPGFRSDVRPWLLASDVFVFPSYREGFPNVVLQAASLKIPCIVSDINGCNEIIVNNHSGKLVAPRNIESLAYEMENLAKDSELRKRFSDSAYKQVVEQFSNLKVWRGILNEYLSLKTDM